MRNALINAPLFLAVLMLTSCAKSCTESALSEVVLSEPELLTIEVKMEKEVGGSQSTQVWVKDKNGQALTLKNGGVSLNGNDLSIAKSLFSKLPYYYAGSGDTQLKSGGKYDLNVLLGSGESFSSSMKLPSNNIEFFELPVEHSAEKELEISWNKIHPEYSVSLEWEKRFQRDTISEVSMGEQKIRAGQTSYRFSPDFFKLDRLTASVVNLRLVSEMEGQINTAFRSDSFWSVRFSANGSVPIKPNQVL